MILLMTSDIVFSLAQTRSVVISPWVWGLAIAALLVFVIWRGRRWTQGRGVTRAHQAETSERQQRAHDIMGHKEEQKQPSGPASQAETERERPKSVP